MTSLTGTVSGHDTVGGLVGQNSGSGSVITRSFTRGSVSADNTVGGLVGLNTTSADINNSYSRSSVTAQNSTTADAGGLVGSNSASSTVHNSYSTGLVSSNSGASGTTGGLVGVNDNNNHVVNSFWDYQTSGRMTSAGGTALPTIQLKAYPTFTGVAWDISKFYGQNQIWRIYEGNTYQLLHWFLIPLSGPFTVDNVTKSYAGQAFSGGSSDLPSSYYGDVFFGGTAQGAKNVGSYGITL